MKLVNDNHMYAKVAKLIKNRKELTDDKLAELEEIVMDDAKVKAIVDASKSSMGIYNILLPFFPAIYDKYHLLSHLVTFFGILYCKQYVGAWVKVFRIIPEFRILRLTFQAT